MRLLIITLAIIALVPQPAYAYIGPGAGLGAIATFLALILGLALLAAGFIWYPLRRALKKHKSENGSAERKPAKDKDL